MMKSPAMRMLPRKILDVAQYRYRGAQETDYACLIDEPTVILGEDGRPRIVYLELDDDCTEIVDALQHLYYNKSTRSGGLITTSAVIGYLPRITTRRDYCTAASAANVTPAYHAIVTSYAAKVSCYYQEFHPDLYMQHQQLTEQVLPSWRIEDTVFTSGIVNKDNPLLYHFDTGNFKGVWSNMLVFKQDVKGGYLAVPEYDCGFYLRNNSLLMFDGQNILHGVTPFVHMSWQAHRYSIVYYSLQQMWHCLTPEEELQRIRKKRTEREYRRLTRDKTGEVYDPDAPIQPIYPL